jgi:hypothetical protein
MSAILDPQRPVNSSKKTLLTIGLRQQGKRVLSNPSRCTHQEGYTMTYRTLRVRVALGVLAFGLTGIGATAQAQTILSGSGVGANAFGGMNYVNFDNLTLTTVTGSQSAAFVNASVGGTIGVSYVTDGGVVSGATSSVYAPPSLSGTNNLYFESTTPVGPDGTHYMTAGGLVGPPASSVTLNFGSQGYNYLGLLWGSVDTYNSLTFYAGSHQVGTLTGSSVLTPPNGDQGVSGTAYINIGTSFAFNRVVLTSTQHAFEFDNVAFGAIGSVPPLFGTVPEPASVVMFGTAFLVVSGVTWSRNRKAKAVSQS